MFSNLQIRPAKLQRRKPSLSIRAGVTKRRVSGVSALSASNVPSLSFMEGLFGDEFPEAFGSGDGRSVKSRKTILDLPAELLETVCQHISKLDIKRLRLASKHLASSVYLRIDRVYISPNRANLDYLHNMLAHPRYKGRVHEIVWDDVRLQEYPTLDSFREAILVDERETMRAIESRLEEAIWIYGEDNPEYHALEQDDLFEHDNRLTEAAKEILLRYDDQFSRDVLARNATMMNIEDSYALYQVFYQDEQAIAEHQLDINALHQALAGFPKLKRVTFTTEVWRLGTSQPRYNTPFHRSLPVGFRKPNAGRGAYLSAASNQARNGHMKIPTQGSRLPIGSRGYSILMSALVMLSPSIDEFIVDSDNEAMAVNQGDTDFTSQNYENTRRMFQQTPLKRLKFFINSETDSSILPASQNANTARDLLAELHHLQHLDLNLNYNKTGLPFGPVPRTIPIPENLRPQLKSLVLRQVAAEKDDLFGLLTSLPKLQYIALHRLQQWNDASCWSLIFQRLRAYYNTVAHTSRPSFTLVQPLFSDDNHFQLVEEEVNTFLYEYGENPFLQSGTGTFVQIKPHMGWRVDTRNEVLRERMRDL